MDCRHPGSSPWDFPRQEFWSGLPFPSPGELRDPGIEPEAPVLTYGFFTAAPPGKPLILLRVLQIPLPSNFIPYIGICGAQQCSGGAAETNGNPTNTIIRIWSTHSLCFLASCSPPRGAAVAHFLAFVLVAAAINCCSSSIPWPAPCRRMLSLTSHGRTGFSSHCCLPLLQMGRLGVPGE